MDLSYDATAFPRAAEVRKFLYSNALLGTSVRFRRLDRMDAWRRGLEYAHQQYDWSGYPADNLETISPQAVMPYGYTQPAMDIDNVRLKRPTAPLRLCPMVVNRFTGLLFSEERVPELHVEGDSDSEDFLRAVMEAAHFWGVMHQARTYGGSMGAALITVRLDMGRFSYEAYSPKVIQEIAWEDRQRMIPAGVLIQYITYQEIEELDAKTGAPTGRVKEVPFLYRRIIDSEADTVFKPAQIEGNQLPILEVDAEQSQLHRLGYFPGVWVQNLPDGEDIDGEPDCAGAYQIFDTVDRVVAQANKALLANMDPTLVVGLDPKMGKADTLVKGSGSALNVGLQGHAAYLEIGGGGITTGQSFLKDLVQHAMNIVQCVLVDPEKISGAAQSAKAVEYIYAPMLEKASRIRKQYTDYGIIPLLRMTLRIAQKYSNPAEYDGNAVPSFILPPRVVEKDPDPDNPNSSTTQELVKRVPGRGGNIVVRWGPYFSPTPADIQMATATIANVRMAKLMDRKTAIDLIAPLFNIRDTEQVLRRVLEEEAEEERKAMDGIYGQGGDDKSPLQADHEAQEAAADDAQARLTPTPEGAS